METALELKSQKTLQNVEDYAMSPDTLLKQIMLIQDVMKSVMQENVHYGKIPGCGDKPTLLKPGAEKLCLTFRLAPEFEITATNMANGHREYEIVCNLKSIVSGDFIASGVGCCSTMESKYRYRTENTGKPVPKEYWDTRDSSLLGGHVYSAKKVGKEWKIFHKVDHDNPADYYNTVKKMAKKRALVDAILSATAASDIFTQDVEELAENGVINSEVKEEVSKPKETKKLLTKEDLKFAFAESESIEHLVELKKKYKDDYYALDKAGQDEVKEYCSQIEATLTEAMK